MKDRILTFIIGLLVGAIITTICFFVYSKTNNNRMMDIPNRGEMPQMMQDDNGERPEKPFSEVPNDNGTPEMPSDNTTNS